VTTNGPMEVADRFVVVVRGKDNHWWMAGSRSWVRGGNARLEQAVCARGTSSQLGKTLIELVRELQLFGSFS
jgi:hypothetical protein